MLFADKLLKAKEDKAAGPIVATMMGTLNKLQRENVQKNTESDKVEKDIDEGSRQRLHDGAAKSLGTEVKGDFAKAFDDEYQKVLKDNAEFHELVKKALGTDRAAADEAKKKLYANYDPESVSDFIAGQLKNKNDGVAVDTTRAFANEDTEGNLSLSLKAQNVAFGDKDREQVLYLGKKDQLDAIRGALEAALSDPLPKAHDGNSDAPVDNRFNLFAVESEQSAREAHALLCGR